MRIHLLHTNDVHSQLENYMRLGCLLRQRRGDIRDRGEHALTFDIGDVMDRVRPETEATHGFINVGLMEAIGYDGWVFGNNEGLTIRKDMWPELITRANTTTFGTNLRDDLNQPFSFLTDERVYEVAGIKIGVFGLTANYREPYEHLGVCTLSPFERAAESVASLQKRKVDIIVLLSHLGLWEDRKLAHAVEGIDIILGGHSHNFMDGVEWVGQTAIYQPGKHALVFGDTVLEIDDSTRRILDVQSTPIHTDLHGSLDDAMQRAYQDLVPQIRKELNRSVACLDEPLTVRYDKESLFANVLADVLYEAYPCDLAVMMSGALTSSLLAGEATLEHVHGACTTPTRPLLMTLSGRDILAIISKAVTPEYFDRKGFGYGFRGSVVGWLALANAQATVCRSTSHSSPELQYLQIGGVPVDPNRLYRLVTCEYLWLSNVYEEFQNGTDISIEPPLVREVLLQKLGDNDRIIKAKQLRYPVVD